MPRRKAAPTPVGDARSKPEDASETTRRLNVQISESAFEALMVHMVKLKKPLGVLVTDALKLTYNEYHIHGNPRRGRGGDPSVSTGSDEEVDRLDLYSPVMKTGSEAA